MPTTSMEAFFIAAGLGALIYLAARFTNGARADYLAGLSAIPITFMCSPWFVSLAGASLGHVVAVAVFRKLTKQKQQRLLTIYLVIAFGVSVVMSTYTVYSVAHQVMTISNESDQKNWEAFAARSETNRFVFENYRPCIEAKSYSHRAVNSKNDPSVCRAAAVSLAASTKGGEYAQSVNVAIESWNAWRPIDPKSQIMIDELASAIR